jgi:DNA-binding beta-propeller fold protein YncE
MKRNPFGLTFRKITAFIIVAVGFLLSTPLGSEAQAGKAYISSQDGSKLYVVDLSKNSIVKTINIFTPTALGRVLPPNINDVIAVGERIFMSVPGPEISPTGVNEVKVIDSRSDTVVATLKMDMTPSGLLEYKGKVYVVNRYGSTIQEIDPKTLRIVRTIPFPIPKSVPMNLPLFMEIANDKIYLPFPGGISRPGGIQVLDLKTGTALEFIDFGYGHRQNNQDGIYLNEGSLCPVIRPLRR